MLKTKSVRSSIDGRGDGLRLLVARFRGRAMSSSCYDVWMPSLGPSEKLLAAFQSGRRTWAQFAREYRDELFAGSHVDSRNKTILNHGQKFTLRLIKRLARSGNVTLLCHCPEGEAHCHRHVLQKLILSREI
jgi:uncharacterized protein YeaO (DUF488 family)